MGIGFGNNPLSWIGGFVGLIWNALFPPRRRLPLTVMDMREAVIAYVMRTGRLCYPVRHGRSCKKCHYGPCRGPVAKYNDIAHG